MQSCNQHWLPWGALLSVSWFVSNTHTHKVLAEKQKRMPISQGPYPEVVEIYANDVTLKT